MKGKINKYGLLCKELPGRGLTTCRCINNGEETARDYGACYYCNDECVAFEGPLLEGRCDAIGLCRNESICDPCRYYKPTGRTLIKICQGRELVFDEFVDERVK